MASMLEAYNALMKKQLRYAEKEVKAVKHAKQHPVFIERKEALLGRKQDRYQRQRVKLETLLASGNMEHAKMLFLNDTDTNYIQLEPIYTRKNSPKQTLKQKHQKAIVEKGGPIHPNLLPSHMVNKTTKKVKQEYRPFAKVHME